MLETTSELLSLTTTSTDLRQLSRCWASWITPLTTTKSSEPQKTARLVSKLMVDTVMFPTTHCWMLTAVSTSKTLQAHLHRPHPCVRLHQTHTELRPVVPLQFRLVLLHTWTLNRTAGAVKSVSKSPSLTVRRTHGLLDHSVPTPSTQD